MRTSKRVTEDGYRDQITFKYEEKKRKQIHSLFDFEYEKYSFDYLFFFLDSFLRSPFPV